MEKQPFTNLHSDRLDLRPHRCGAAYTTKIYNIIAKNRLHFKDFMPLIYSVKDAKEEQNFLESCVEKWEKAEEANFAIYLKNTDTIVGCIGVFDMDFDKASCEIGFWLAKNYEGNGYIHESVKTVEDYFFTKGFSTIRIVTAPENIRSQNVAIRAGYSYQGTRKAITPDNIIAGYDDEKVFIKTKANWENQR